MLSTLLEEAGIDPRAKWVIAEGADSLALHRSVPITKALDDAMIALYQNGERIRPGNGYPMRLLLPGWEGNMNVKWLRRLQLTEMPAMGLLRGQDLRPHPAERRGVPVLLPPRGQVVHHSSLSRPEVERAGALRDLRHRLFGQRTHLEGHGLGRRWHELGAGGAANAGTAEGVCAVPLALALGWQARRPAEPRLG